MSGRVIRAVPRTDLDFSWVDNGTTEYRYAAGRIDASQFTQVDLWVRVHSRELVSGGQILVRVIQDGYTNDDPGNSFLGSPLATVTIDSSTEPGTLLTKAATSELGPALAVLVEAVQPASAGSLIANISVDLALKGA